MNSMLDFRFYTLMVCIWILLPVCTHADSVTSLTCEEGALDCEEALTCEEEYVREAVNKIVKNGSGTVYIPEGDCTWENDVDVEGPVKIIGAGIHKTTIRSSYKQIFNHVKAGGDSDIMLNMQAFHSMEGRAAGPAKPLCCTMQPTSGSITAGSKHHNGMV